jgi:hypothetical protein
VCEPNLTYKTNAKKKEKGLPALDGLRTLRFELLKLATAASSQAVTANKTNKPQSVEQKYADHNRKIKQANRHPGPKRARNGEDEHIPQGNTQLSRKIVSCRTEGPDWYPRVVKADRLDANRNG